MTLSLQALFQVNPATHVTRQAGAWKKPETKKSLRSWTQNSLEDVVNVCIVQAIKGKAPDPSSEEMQDIVSHKHKGGKL